MIIIGVSKMRGLYLYSGENLRKHGQECDKKKG